MAGCPTSVNPPCSNSLTRAGALASNYPFATIDPNVGVVGIAKPRLPVLAEMFNAARVVPATARFVDIADLVHGASQGQGRGLASSFLRTSGRPTRSAKWSGVFADPDVSYVAAGLGHDHFRDAPDAGDRDQAGDNRSERLGGPGDQIVQRGDLRRQVVAGVQVQSAHLACAAVNRPSQAISRSSSLARSFPRASPAGRNGSRSPPISASIIPGPRRPATPRPPNQS